jgi:hypothetical protein
MQNKKTEKQKQKIQKTSWASTDYYAKRKLSS